MKGDRNDIHAVDEVKALTLLRNEVNDYSISQAIKPYREVTNRLITMLNEDAFRTKETIVEALTRLVSRHYNTYMFTR